MSLAFTDAEKVELNSCSPPRGKTLPIKHLLCEIGIPQGIILDHLLFFYLEVVRLSTFYMQHIYGVNINIAAWVKQMQIYKHITK